MDWLRNGGPGLTISAVLVGFSFGFAAAWYYFSACHMLRSREEWFRWHAEHETQRDRK